ncbi:MAG: glycosyltransferase family 2 protein [Eubacteriales bacterium]|nr:glycosyltransferase family 2 protein [Eubacteriales bacterium]
MTRVSLVIPCYNSSKTVGNVIDNIKKVMSERYGYEYEIILVNDCSADQTKDVIEDLCESDKNIKGLSLAKNFGQHAALMAGYAVATGELVVSMDDDGQTPASEMFKLIDKLNEGYDVVYASYEDKKHNSLRNFGSKLNTIMAELLIEKPKDLQVTSYFVAKRFVIDEILYYKNAYPYILGLVFRTTHNIANVPVEHRERTEGKSNYNLKKLVSLWMNGFTAFSVKPLRIATAIGLICAILGFIFAIYTIIHKLLNPNMVAGYSSMMSVQLFIGGLILMVLGLIGEYIGRIYISINNSPQYVIRETFNLENEVNRAGINHE